MTKNPIKRVFEEADGWSKWISPTKKKPYQMACCDCGLVHDLEFKAVRVVEQKRGGWWTPGDLSEPWRVLLRARRNQKATTALRQSQTVETQ